ncbi:hypothetical protein [Acidiphilium cryptum]|uniref:Transposase IS4-like domain-containing protein n=1 Tax=Acidiphilium cryptum (strain JF-5) TaxID=349163 RepID=A5FTE4_ACICJ|nr:hypothetical protein Acry_3261 [Acidiphilium cryptum JF-5]
MMLLTEGQMSDHKGATMMLPTLPLARELLADRGYDSDAFRAALLERGITPLHSINPEQERAATARQGALPAAPPHREHVRSAQGQPPLRLAPGTRPITASGV